MIGPVANSPAEIMANKRANEDRIAGLYLAKRNNNTTEDVETLGQKLFKSYETAFGWKEYLMINHGKTVESFNKKNIRYKSITIDFNKLSEYEDNDAYRWFDETKIEKTEKHPMSKALYNQPDKTFEDIRTCLEDLKDEYAVDNVEIHVTNLDMPLEIRDIRIDNVDKIYSINCSVSKIGQVRPVLIEGVYECARCKELVAIPQTIGESEIRPQFCNCNEEKKGVFRLINKESKYYDYQLTRLCENIDSCTNGEQPQTIDARLINDLCGNIVPGERIIIYGILRVILKRDGRGIAKTNRDMVIEVVGFKKEDKNTFIITPEDEAEIKKLAADPEVTKKIIKSIAPSVHGNDELKHAVALVLVGGVKKRFPDNTIQRGDSHLLVVGDPGVAKSVILKAASRLIVRGMMISGKGASGVGLTAAAVKDNFGGDKWSIEAGALPLSNGGTVIVDEFDKLSENDRDCLHSALEDQEIEIAKAGLRARLKTQCKLITAANPMFGRFDEHKDLSEQINMKPSLLSRFDIIYILRDRVDVDEDGKIANSVIAAHAYGGRIERYRSEGIGYELVPVNESEKFLVPEIREDLLKKYFYYASHNVFPIFEDGEDGSQQYLIDVYKTLRTSSKDLIITARQLGGLIRLSEASARLRLSSKVSREDVDEAVKLYLTAMREAARSGTDGSITNLMVDISASQAERMKAIFEFMQEHDDPEGLSKKAVIAALALIGYDDSSTYRNIAQLKKNGKIVEFPNGKIRLSI